MPLAAEDVDLARLGAGLELELDRAVERLDRDRRAERGLDDRQVDLREDVVALAHEALVGPDPHADVDVAGATAERARVALAGEADPLAVVDARRDLDVERRAPRACGRRRRTSRTDARRSGRCRGTPGRSRCGRTRRRGCARPAGAARGRRSARQVETLVPGLTPSPLHVSHVTATSSGTVADDAAGGVDEVDLDLARRRRRRARPPAAPRRRRGRRRRRPRRGRRGCRRRSASA